MTSIEILEQLEKLPAPERLDTVESTVRQQRQEFQIANARTSAQKDVQLERAAKDLLADYATDKELTALTALNGEAFHE